MNVAVLGAGVGGRIVAKGIKLRFPDINITLVGPDANEPEGLFYINDKIEGIAEKPIKVIYSSTSTGDTEKEDLWKKYQIKSRGVWNPDVSISSFDKVGTSETGYCLDPELSLDDIVKVEDLCIEIDTVSRRIVTKNSTINFDYMISTVPLTVLVRLLYGGTDISRLLSYRPVYVVDFTDDCLPCRSNEISEIVTTYDLTDSIFYRHNVYLDKDRQSVITSSETLSDPKMKCKVVPYGKIITDKFSQSLVSKIEDDHKFLKLCGRYARWDYHYLVTDSYNDSLKFIRDRSRRSD